MGVLNARMLGLVIAALLTIALLFTVPLSDFASARAEARAGDTVAIAGGDDCDVDTDDEDEDDNDIDGDDNDVDGDDIDGDDNDVDGDDSVNDEDDTDGDGIDDVDEDEDDTDDDLFGTDDEDDGDQAQDDDEDNGDGAVVARAGDAVAIAGGCETDSETVETESFEVETNDIDEDTDEDDLDEDSIDENGEDIEVVEDDDEFEDRTADPDGETTDTSDLITLLPEDDSSDGSSAERTVVQENGFGFGGTFGTGDESRQGRTASSSDPDWPRPRRSELEKLGETRRFDPNPDAAMTLSIRTLGLYDVPVLDSSTRKGLGQGAIHAPDTAYPWDEASQKNVFIAGHRLGSPEKKSRLIFYYLDELEPGDEIVLKDREGRSYGYRVRELFKVSPDDAWAADTLVGRDLLTLQTYTLPDSEDRLIVRADRIQPRER